MNSELPKLPGYSLKRVLKIRELVLTDPRIQGWRGSTLDRVAFAKLARNLENRLPGEIRRQLLHDSFSYLIGQPFTEEQHRQLATLLGGGFYELREDRPIAPSRPITQDTWMIARVSDVYRQYHRGKKTIVTQVQMRIIVGPLVGLTFTQVWSSAKGGYFRKEFGFNDDYLFLNLLQLGRLLIYAFFPQAEFDPEKPQPATFKGSGALIRENRKILAMRQRINFPCPEGLTIHCHDCGLSAEDCPAAVRDPGKSRLIYCSSCDQQAYVTTSVERRQCDRCYRNHFLNKR